MLNCEPASAAANLLTCAKQIGADFVFTNLGSDHPAFIQAFSELDAGHSIPEIISCPHEMTALSAAHGYAMITRRPQLVLVHVDVGTQNLGCSIHNAARGRVPVIIVAGLSPVTLYGQRPGTRTEFIHYLQEVPSQTEIVRQYMKWTHELRAPETVHHIMLRGGQMACAEPQGPVYITGGREFWEEEAAADSIPLTPPARLGGLPPGGERELWELLSKARRPLLITSYLGRNTQAVERLVKLSELTGIAVQEVAGQYMNFPSGHPNHVGYRRDSLVDEADLILAVDTDVPWLPNNVRPGSEATAIGIDCDPQKDRFGLWSYPLHAVYHADSNVVFEQLLTRARASGAIDDTVLAARRDWIAEARGVDAQEAVLERRHYAGVIDGSRGAAGRPEHYCAGGVAFFNQSYSAQVAHEPARVFFCQWRQRLGLGHQRRYRGKAGQPRQHHREPCGGRVLSVWRAK